jgi:GDP/UDP-N,N'-diacetylbacillosamine 2-epimerase (hydrolysing)
MKRKILVVTGTRAEYGLLRPLLREIVQEPSLELQLVATGMHLAPEFGMTITEIEQDGFHIDRRIDMLLSADTGEGIGKSVGLGVLGFAQALAELHPQMMLVLGDRFEILAAVVAALMARVPVAHIHGGEVTTGAIDDAIRHAITKMSHWHFASAEAYRNRIIQLGEAPERVYCVGGLGVDVIAQTSLLNRAELECCLGLQFQPRNLLVTFHPATLNAEPPSAQMQQLLDALSAFPDVGLVFTFPNADAGGRELIGQIKEFAIGRPHAHAFASLGQLRYLSCLALCDGVVGNSSSGLLEAPSLKKGTVNIGDRQRGRLQAQSVINCEPRAEAITTALKSLLSPAFQAGLQNAQNPYGEAGASKRIVNVLKDVEIGTAPEKHFYDLPAERIRKVQ